MLVQSAPRSDLSGERTPRNGVGDDTSMGRWVLWILGRSSDDPTLLHSHIGQWTIRLHPVLVAVLLVLYPPPTSSCTDPATHYPYDHSDLRTLTTFVIRRRRRPALPSIPFRPRPSGCPMLLAYAARHTHLLPPSAVATSHLFVTPHVTSIAKMNLTFFQRLI